MREKSDVCRASACLCANDKMRNARLSKEQGEFARYTQRQRRYMRLKNYFLGATGLVVTAGFTAVGTAETTAFAVLTAAAAVLVAAAIVVAAVVVAAEAMVAADVAMPPAVSVAAVVADVAIEDTSATGVTGSTFVSPPHAQAAATENGTKTKYLNIRMVLMSPRRHLQATVRTYNQKMHGACFSHWA
jgi:hypothetical protein